MDNRNVVTWRRTEGRMDCPMEVDVCAVCEERLYPVYCQVSYGMHWGTCAGCVYVGSGGTDGRREVEHSALRAPRDA